uniref:Uncharacterized protein n=1 Tax=Timema poppense TaxID=170557 RepID=A0A7R9CZN5_TIMPO|nr:unnamed protein product [Timema poppensis]
MEEAVMNSIMGYSVGEKDVMNWDMVCNVGGGGCYETHYGVLKQPPRWDNTRGILVGGVDRASYDVPTADVHINLINDTTRVWDPHLRFLMELRAHESVVFHLATIGDTLYTCSNDGTIKAWDIDTLEHKKTLLQYDSEVWRFFAAQGRLYAGDVQGTVRVYENDELMRIYDLTEEVRDMAVSTQLLYTVRDRDLVITELLPGMGDSIKNYPLYL